MFEKGFKNKLSSDHISVKTFIWTIIGIVLFFLSTILLFLNDAFPTSAEAIKSTEELTTANAELDGKGVWIKGSLHSEKRATDSFYLADSDYIIIIRYVQMYSYFETENTDSDGDHLSYTYYESWTSYPSIIRNKLHIDNPEKTLPNLIIAANNLKISDFNIKENIDMDYVEVPILNLKKELLSNQGHTLKDNYIYLKSNIGSAEIPFIGDCRILYRVLRNGSKGIAVAKLDGNDLIKFDYVSKGVYPFTKSIYSFYSEDSIDKVIKTQEAAENQIVLWVLRIAGALFMICGFSLLLLNLALKTNVLPFLKEKFIWTQLLCIVFPLLYSTLICVLANCLNTIFTFIGILLFLAILSAPLIYILNKRRLKTERKTKSY